jgi:hypothetical protein
MQSPATGKFRHARLLWLLGFALLAGGFGILLWHSTEARPFVTFPDGTVFNFAGITKPTPGPALAGVSRSGLRHVPPGRAPSSWSIRYQRVWNASPSWLKRWLPIPQETPGTYHEEIWGLRSGTPKYSVWMESSGGGSDFPAQDWSVDANCTTRGWSYGAETSTLDSGGKFVTPPPKIWYRVNLDSLPPKGTPHLIVKFTSEDGRNTVVLEIPNPDYEPAGR